MSLSRKNLFSSIFIVLSLVVLSLGYLLYVQLSDLDNIKGMVLDELQKTTHRDVSIEKAKISFTEGLGLELQNFVLHSKSGGKPDFTADSLWVVFRLLPLVNQKISLVPGWNLVGYPSETSYNRTLGLNTLNFGSEIDCIQWYDAGTKTWHFMGSSDVFVKGRGYWMHSKVTT